MAVSPFARRLIDQLLANKQEEAQRSRIQHRRALDLQGGGGAALGSFQAAQADRRKDYLIHALQRGNLSPLQLGESDRQLLGTQRAFGAFSRSLAMPVGKAIVGKGEPTPVEAPDENVTPGEWLVNFGKGAVETFAGIPQSAYDLVKTLGQSADPTADILTHTAGVKNIDGEPYQAPEIPIVNMGKNLVEAYKYKYGPFFEGDPGEGLHRVAQDPFGTVVDIGALATGGAGVAARAGSLATKAAEAGTLGAGENVAALGRALQRPASTERAPLLDTEGTPTADRRYSRSPMMKYGIQKPFDILAKEPESRIGIGKASIPIGKIARAHLLNKSVDKIYSQFKLAAANVTNKQVRDFTKKLGKLTPEEFWAWNWGAQGLTNHRLSGMGGKTMIDQQIEYLERSINGENPEGLNAADMGVDASVVQAKLDSLRDPNVRALITVPSDRMRDFHADYEKITEDLNMREPISPDQVEAERFAPSQAMRREALARPDLSFNYAKREAEDWEGATPLNPVYLEQQLANKGHYGPGGEWIPDEAKPKTGDEIPAADKLFDRQPGAHYTNEDMKTLLAGSWRHDKAALEHSVLNREKEVARKFFEEDFVDQWAWKDPEGVATRYDNAADMKVDLKNHGKSPDDYYLVAPGPAMRFFMHEIDLKDELISAYEKAAKNAEGKPLDSEDLRAALDAMTGGEAARFKHEELGAMREPGYAVPKAAMNRLRQHFEAARGHEGSPLPMRAWAVLLNKWRVATLLAMPRWWLNTIGGNTIQAVLAGTLSPRHMRMARRLIKQDKAPPGGRLGMTATETLEEGGPKWRPVVKLWHAAQYVEDHIRVMSHLKLIEKEALRAEGEVLDAFGKKGLTDENLEFVMEHHPEIVDWATEEMNKFFYNYMDLGPFERKWVRQLVPFWGWYKFATKLAWRLPVEYPGRTNILNKLSMVAGDTTDEELGQLPPAMVGTLILNRDPNNASYLPVLGLNPLGEFATPFDPNQGVQGLFGLNQLAPPLQAVISAFGIDPFKGSTASLSPELNIAQNYFGQYSSTDTGAPRDPADVGWFQRLVGTGLRSIPQVNIAERLTQGGAPVYPESIPFVDEQPIPVSGQSLRDTSPLGILGSFTGISPRNMDVLEAQKGYREDILPYVKGRKKNALDAMRQFQLSH